MSRDVLRTLTEARPAELSPEVRMDETTRAAELGRAMLGTPARERSRRSLARPAFGLGVVGVAAAAAVAAVVVVPDGSGAPSPGPAPVALDARTVLLAAAERTDTVAEAPGKYWYRKEVSRSRDQVTTAGQKYTIEIGQSLETWVPGFPGGKTWHRTQNLGFRPFTSADRAAWQKAGSPSRVEVRHTIAPNLPNLKTAAYSAAPGRPSVGSSPLTDGDKVFWLGRNVTMKDLRSLPTRPETLRKELMRWYKGHDTEASSVPMSADRWLFTVGGSLLTELPVTAKTRGAAFRMLAALPIVRSVGKVRDAEGRTGVAVAVTDKTLNGVQQHRLIIDPDRGEALASETILLKPGGANASLPPNSLLGSSAVLSSTWKAKPLS